MDNDELTKVHVDLPNHWRTKGESVWAKALGDDRYEIRNVPFCAYGLNFGDVVVAVQADPGLKPEVRIVATPSGHRTLRVFFAESVELSTQLLVLEKLIFLGAEVERADDRFVALDIPRAGNYQSIRESLDAHETDGLLSYETCEERIAGSFDDRPAIEN